MGKEVTLTIPDELLENAQRWASITQRNVPETLMDALKIVLTPIYADPKEEKPVATLSDAEVLALTKIQMNESQGRRLNHLLDMQQAGTLQDEDYPALMALMQIYNQLWVRQSEALAEAVTRGIHPPMCA